MSFRIRRVDYFYATVQDRPGEAYAVLSKLAEQGVNLLAVTAVPVGPQVTQLTLFPEDAGRMREIAGQAGLSLNGPHRALLVEGDDELGALAEVHAGLHRASVNVYASSGVTTGDGRYGYIIYVRPEHYEAAAGALEV